MRVITGSLALLLLSFPAAAQIGKGAPLTGNLNKEQFGRNVKISADGNILAVAAPFNSATGEKKGRISVYQFDGRQWQVLGNEIVGEQADFNYGEVMELSADGKRLVVASPFQHVTVYDFDGREWRQAARALSLENWNDQIASLSITQDANIIAVVYKSAGRGGNFLAVQQQNGKQWVPHGNVIMLRPDSYGNRTCLFPGGDKLVVGNYAWSTKKYKRAGEVATYVKENDIWILRENSMTGEFSNAVLGSELALSDNGNCLVAASNSISLLDQTAGFVETYDSVSHGWKRQAETLKPEKQNPYFGHAMALSADGGVLAVSMPYIGYGKPGVVTVYKRQGSRWKEITTIKDWNGVESTSLPNNSTGWSIDLSADGNTLAIGFPHNDENGDMSGKVVVYDLKELMTN